MSDRKRKLLTGGVSISSFFKKRNVSNEARAILSDEISSRESTELVSDELLIATPLPQSPIQTTSTPQRNAHQRKTGIDPKWKQSFPWLETKGDGMLCSLCIKHQRRPKKCVAGRATWVDVPCTSIRKASLTLHKESEAHKEAVTFETTAALTGGIEAGFVREEEVNKQALIASMKLLYMLCKEEIPHTTKYQPLLRVVKDLGVDVLNCLEKGGNAKYTSERHIQDCVKLFADEIWTPIKEDILASPHFSVLVDETTDVTTTLELIVYVRFLKLGKSRTVFATMMSIPDGKAETITSAIRKWFLDAGIPLANMVAFGSDGAAVMVGKKTGVATRLKEDVPHLLANHCVAHRLALASAQAAASVPYLVRFKRIVEQLFRFYEYSGVRTSGLREIQTLLQEPQVKMAEAKDVRWLSHDRAVRAICRCLPSILTSLDREASERTDAQAQGLLGLMQTYDFVASLYMFADVLPVLSSLSRAFQTRDGAYTLVGSLVSETMATVRSFRDQPGENSRKVPQVMEDLTSQPFKFHEPTQRERDLFKTNVYDKFLDAVENNLQKRFPDIPMLESFGAFNIQQWPQDEAQLEDHGKESIQLLADHLHTILPLPEDVQAEYRLLKNAVKDDPQLGEQPTHKVLEEVAGPLSEPLPNLATIASVGLLIPTSTADCERGFSTLSRVKTKLRNRMNDRTVNALLMISMEGPEVLDFNFNHAVTTWATSKTRRLKVL